MNTQTEFTFFQFDENTFPNLDGFMLAGDLAAFRVECRQVEEGLAQLRSYAEAKQHAMECRYAGKIVSAQRFEDAAQEVYNRLPAWVRW